MQQLRSATASSLLSRPNKLVSFFLAASSLVLVAQLNASLGDQIAPTLRRRAWPLHELRHFLEKLIMRIVCPLSIFAILAVSAAAPCSLQAATCTVPNAIANGQIADASKIMNNFNAVANCAQQAITATGVPTAGSLPVFSGPGTIASGNLTGDITTSGGTATTLSSSGVTPGAYGDASNIPRLTVDAKGRVTGATLVPVGGSAGTGLFSAFMSGRPTIAGTGLSNLIGSSPVQVDTPAGVYLSQTGANGPVEYTSTVPTAPYSVTALLATNYPTGVPSLGWTNGTAMHFIYVSGSKIVVQSNNNISSWVSTNAALSGSFNPRLTWLRISDDGARVSFQYSSDGFNFITVYSVLKSAGFLGSSGYSHIMTGSPGGSGPADMTVISWMVG